MKTVLLKPRRSAPFKGHHPWLFSGAIDQVEGNPMPGEEVIVCDEHNSFLAYGLFNPHSQIRVRLYSFGQGQNLDANFWRDKIRQAVSLRFSTLGFTATPDSACRLVNSEGDGLSGLTVDRYGDYLCVQFTSLGLYLQREVILAALVESAPAKGIILRTEADVLAAEGLEARDGILQGSAPENPVVILEQDVKFEINLSTGQKTGFYLDQCANRTSLEAYASGKSVLDLCSYTGGFALHAAKAGAHSVTAVDVSLSALEQGKRNAELNGFNNIEYLKSDMFKYVDNCLAEGKKYDLIVLDPPKMTHAKASVQSALKGYLTLNANVMKCLTPGGILFTCSCSGRVSRDDFLLTLHRAALAANRSLRILEVRGANTDHPVDTACPESEYLKCVVCYAE